MWQMPFLSKEMAESVRNEIVLHPPDSNARCPPPSNSSQTPPISHFTSLEWSPALFQCSLQCAVHLSPLWLSRFTTLKWSQSHNFTLGGRQWWFYPEIAQVQKRSKNLDKHLLAFWYKLLLLIWLHLLQFVACNDKAMQIHTINIACLIANNVCKFHIVLISACVGQQPSFVSQL